MLILGDISGSIVSRAFVSERRSERLDEFVKVGGGRLTMIATIRRLFTSSGSRPSDTMAAILQASPVTEAGLLEGHGVVEIIVLFGPLRLG